MKKKSLKEKTIKRTEQDYQKSQEMILYKY